MSNLVVSVIMAALFVVIVGWDVYLALDGRRANTISARIRDWDRKFGGIKLLMAAGFGLLLGHWFWT